MGGKVLDHEAKTILLQGKAQGKAEGENKLAKLMQFLFAAGDYQNAQKAASDEAVRKELYKKYGMID